MDADVLIIGGGVAGQTLGAEIAGSAKVILCEAEASLGYHASGRSAALYEPKYGAKLVRALTEASGEWYRNSGLLAPRGLMLVGRRGEEEAFEEDRLSMGIDRISLEEARAKVPVLNDTIVAAAFNADAWDIDTDLLLQTAARHIRAEGGDIRLNAPVTAIARHEDGWVVTAGGRQITARIVVNAAGAWVNQIADMAGVAGPRFQPNRRSMARIPAPEGLDVSGWPMIFGSGETWYAKPDAGALIVSPAEEEPMDPFDAWPDDMVLAEGLARYEEYVTEPVSRLLSSWAGLRTFSPDREPVIGFDPLAPNFFWLAGQGGYGFQTAPAAARLAGDLILGRRPTLDAETVAGLSPQRFA